MKAAFVLHLFYPDAHFDGNGVDLPQRVVWSLLIFISLTLSLRAIRCLGRKSRANLTNTALFALCCVRAPLCITLFFVDGRVTIFTFVAGVHKMT